MSVYVLDCSVTMAWCFGDQGDDGCLDLLRELQDGRAWVPGLWSLEVANVLAGAERRGRIRVAQSERFLAHLQALPIEVDPSTPAHALGRTLSLARAHGLSSYDAAYLELALRRGLPLATRDAGLSVAAEALGVAVR